MRKFRVAVLIAITLLATPAFAARCGGSFNAFVQNFSAEAQGAGISPDVISQALSGVTQDPAVLAFDRRQHATFRKSFEAYVATASAPAASMAAARCWRAMPRCSRASNRNSACPGRSSSRSGDWKAISARAISAGCR
jgi:membrane-bound lytic murein transglycosylase B